MDAGIINVQPIKQKELEERYVQFMKSQLFNKINVYLTEKFDKSLESLSSKGISYGTNLDSALFRIQFFEEHDSFVSILVASVNENNKETEVFVRLNVVDDDNGNTVIWDFLYDKNKNEFELQEERQLKEPANDVWKSIINSNSKDIEEMTNRSEIKASAFGEFCMPGGYQYCGMECGKRGKYGGGAIKNKIDGCCYIHDECYYNNNTSRCARCDIPLINCVMNPVNYKEGPATATAIATYFSRKCSR